MSRHFQNIKNPTAQMNEDYLKTHNQSEQTTAEENIRADQAAKEINISELQQETLFKARSQKANRTLPIAKLTSPRHQ